MLRTLFAMSVHAASSLEGAEITIPLLQNDSDADGQLNASSIRFAATPQNGLLVLRGQSVVYTPNDGFIGRDTFSYTVEDSIGQRSNVATVSVDVEGAWQNPSVPMDVDGDGRVIPRDVLALVLDINNYGSRWLQGRERSASEFYLDVSGDGHLSPVDVLGVVRYLNSASGEPPAETRLEVREHATGSRFSFTDEFFRAFGQATDDEENAVSLVA